MSYGFRSDLETSCYVGPGQKVPMSAVRKQLFPLRRNRLVALRIKKEIERFNGENSKTPIVTAVVKKSSFTRGDLMWGSDIDWLTFYSDCPHAVAEKFVEELTQILHLEYGIYFVTKGEKDEHNFVRCQPTSNIRDLDFSDSILTVFYRNGTSPLLSEDGSFQADQRHFPLDVQPWRIADKAIARFRLLRAFGAVGNLELRAFLQPQEVLLPYRAALPEFYAFVREGAARTLMANPLLPRDRDAFYQAILLQAHFIRYGEKLGVVPERKWFVPIGEERAFTEAFSYLVEHSFLHLPFSGGVVPCWDLYFPGFLTDGLQPIGIHIFDPQGQTVLWPAAEEIKTIPAREKRLRTIASSSKAEDIAEIIDALGPDSSAVCWMAVEALQSRSDDVVIQGLLKAVSKYLQVVSSDEFKSYAKEDIVRINSLWLLLQKYDFMTLDQQIACKKLLSALNIFRGGSSVYKYSATYAHELLARETKNA